MIPALLLFLVFAGETPEPQYSINIEPGQCVKANDDHTFTLVGCPAAAAMKAIKRDPKQVELFRKTHVCPSTNHLTGACPGYVVDHWIPLCANGPDNPANMRWEEYKQSLIKDEWERAICKFLGK